MMAGRVIPHGTGQQSPEMPQSRPSESVATLAVQALDLPSLGPTPRDRRIGAEGVRRPLGLPVMRVRRPERHRLRALRPARPDRCRPVRVTLVLK